MEVDTHRPEQGQPQRREGALSPGPGGANGEVVLGEIIRKAVANMEQTDDYYRALKHFKATLVERPVQQESVERWYRGLAQCVSCLGKRAHELVAVALGSDWLEFGEQTLDAASGFIIELVSAHSIWGEECFRVVIEHFHPRTAGLPPAAHVSQGEYEARKIAQDRVVQRSHECLVEILRVAPLQARLLTKTFRKCFPHHLLPLPRIEKYLRNVFEFALHAPRFRDDALRLSIEKLLPLDCLVKESPLDDEGDGDGDDDDDDATAFRLEEDEEPSGGGGGGGADGPAAPDNATEAPNDSLINKLDRLILLCFEFTRVHMEQGGEPMAHMFEVLYEVFHSKVLATYQCKSIQYLLFYACGFEERFSGAFVERLLAEGLNAEGRDHRHQELCLAYVASFLARARYVTSSHLCSSLQQLCQWGTMYLRQCEAQQVHITFNAACQAVFYTLCFRASDLDLTFMRSLGLETIIGCALDPLKECQAGVAKEFCRVMKAYKIGYFDTILRRGQGRAVVQGFANSDDVSASKVQRLEDFFPFDPYCLPESIVYFEGMYLSNQDRQLNLAKDARSDYSLEDDDDDEDTDDDSAPVLDAAEHEWPITQPQRGLSIPLTALRKSRSHRDTQLSRTPRDDGGKRSRFDLSASHSSAGSADRGFFGSPFSPLNHVPA